MLVESYGKTLKLLAWSTSYYIAIGEATIFDGDTCAVRCSEHV